MNPSPQDPELPTLAGSGLPVEDRATLADLTDRDLDRLMVLGKISRTINESRNIDEVLGRVLDIALDALGAERGLVLLDRGGDEPEVVARRGLPSAPLAYSKSVAQAVMTTGRPLASLDVTSDPALSPSKSLFMMGTRSVLCVPLTTNSRTIGLLYLDSRVRGAIFSKVQLQLAVVIADMAAAAIERSEYFTAVLQNEKMALVGNLLATIVHELNNPLSSILMTVHLLSPENQLDREAVEILDNESRRCQNLVRSLLRLTRQESDVMGPVNLVDIVNETLALVGKDLQRHKQSLRQDLDATVPHVIGNADQLAQVILNLITNASQALRGRPDPCIDVTLFSRPGWVSLSIADNGAGVAPENVRRIFDPFFTTKTAEEGTGIGLALVDRIVKSHGGRIFLESKPEQGALFRVELPEAPPCGIDSTDSSLREASC